MSRAIRVDEVPVDGLAVTVQATAAECEALARFNGLVAVRALEASLQVRPEPGGGVLVRGEVRADLIQTCVVTLEPFDAALREAVDVRFLPPAAHAAFRADRAKAGEPHDDDEIDDPDIIEHDRIDLGELVAEHLTLGVDPYPRKPGATLAVPVVAEEPPPDSPFAVLRTRRKDVP